MSVKIVTSMSRTGYEKYGRRFLETAHHWPFPVTVYSEDDLECPHRVFEDPVHMKFAQGTDESNDYRFQAKRFSYKVFAILDAAQRLMRSSDRLLVWIDADTVAFRDIPAKFLHDLLPKDKWIAYLGRERMHSECGFVIYDCGKLHAFFEAWRNLYATNEIYLLKEWHDSFVFDHLRQKMKIPCENISGPGKTAHHPFINSPLGKYIDHLKGARKDRGRSSRSDLVWKRPEAHWNAQSQG